MEMLNGEMQFFSRWMNKYNCMDFCIKKYILSDLVFLIQAAQIRPPKISLLSSHLHHQLFLVVLWQCVELLV